MENVAPAKPGGGGIFHTVKPGETLWSISKLYNVNLEALAVANDIQDVTAIEKGQVIKIPKAQALLVSAAPARQVTPSKRSRFAWPVRGQVISHFGDCMDKGINKGIDIRALEGEKVVASKAGRIVYCDSFLKGFGQTVIIDHMDGFQTVYSYNSEIVVKVGDDVNERQMIARVGQTGRAREPMLHFEIRRNGEPMNPEGLLGR
jgi:murein DD-endopeptidase MepM/ murein hydrolase activator NlpD